MVGDALDAVDPDRVVGGHALAEDVAVQIDLLEVGEDGLPILHDCQRRPDPGDVPRRVIQVLEYEGGEVQERLVIDSAIEELAFERGVVKPHRRLGPSRGEEPVLFG